MEELVSIEGERGVTRTCIVGGLVGLRGVACGGEEGGARVCISAESLATLLWGSQTPIKESPLKHYCVIFV